MGVEGLESLLGLVAFALQDEEQSLVVVELAVVVQLVLREVFLELLHLLLLVLVVLSLSEVEETLPLLPLLRLLLLLYLSAQLRLGKYRYAFSCKAKGPYLSSTAYILKFNNIHSNK